MTIFLKHCSKCGRELPPNAFRRNRRYSMGITRQCSDCINARRRANHHDNPEIERNRQRDWREKNPERDRARSRRYKEKHQDRVKQTLKNWRSNNPDKIKDYEHRTRPNARIRYKKWINTPHGKEVAKAGQHRRYAIKKQLPADWTAEDWQRAVEYFNECCAVCGRPRGLWHTLARDHWIPLSSPHCPGTISTNVVPLCHGIDGCNNSKKNRPPQEWLTEKFGKRKAKQILARIETYFEWVKSQR